MEGEKDAVDTQPQVNNPNGSSLSHENAEVPLDSVGEPPLSRSISSIDTSSGPSTFIKGNFDQLPHHDGIHQAVPLTLDDYIELSPECTITVNFQGGHSPQKFPKGLCVWDQSGTPFYFDIAEAPFQLNHSKRLSPLERKYAISFNELSNKHIRCHFLTQFDKGNLKKCLENYEGVKSTVAVLLINTSSKLELEPQIYVPDPDFLIKIPIYVTTAENGQKIANHIVDTNSCESQFIFDQSDIIETKSDPEEHHGIVQRTSDKKPHKNSLLEHLRKYIFPSGESKVIVTENPGVFLMITSAFVSKELLTDHNVTEAVNKLSEHLHKIYKRDFIFLIHFCFLLLNSKSATHAKSYAKASQAIDTFCKDFRNYMIKLEIEDIAQIVKSFCERGNFEVMDHNNSAVPIYHKLHSGILRLMTDYLADTKKHDEVMQQDSLCLHVPVVIRWSKFEKFFGFTLMDEYNVVSVALKFIGCSKHGCFNYPIDIWSINMSKLLKSVILTTKVLASLNISFLYGGDLALKYSHTFVGCGSLKILFQKNGEPRTFSELSDIVIHLHKWVQTADEFYDYFCKQTLTIHEEAAKCGKSTAYISSIGGNDTDDIIIKGFQYLDCVCECSSAAEFYNERIEIELQHWITFLLQFLDITNERSVNVIKKLKTDSKHLFIKENLLYHFINEIQQKVKENVLKIGLKHFVDLSCHELWSLEVVIDFFKNYGKNLEKGKSLDEVHIRALRHFSVKFKGAFAHKFLVDHLLIPLSECYIKRNEPNSFILHLVQVNVEFLLIIRDNDKDDVKIVEGFETFLHRYISNHNICAKLPEHFQQIKVQLKSMNKFKKIVMNVLAEKISNGSLKDHNWLTMFTSMSESLCLAIKEGDKNCLHFYWKIFDGICKRIKITTNSTIDEIHQYHDILCILGPVYLELKKGNFSKKDDSKFLQVEVFMTIAGALIQALRNHKRQTENNEVDFDQLSNYYNKYEATLEIADKFGVKAAVAEKEVVTIKRKTFLQYHEFLSKLMIQSLKNSPKWSSRHDILSAYNCEFPSDILEGINDSVYFPSEKTTDITVQDPPCHLFRLEVKTNVTLSRLEHLINAIKIFLGPLLQMIPMLDHFYLNESHIFKAFVKSELPIDGNVTPEQLAMAIETVKSKLGNILTGVVTFSDIEPIVGASKNLKLIKQEIEIITSFPDFQSYGSTDAVVHFENAIILHQILKDVNPLFTFCEEFGLQECLKNKYMIRLKEIVDGYKSEKSWKEENLTSITAKVVEIQDIFGVEFSAENRSEKFQFLTLFEPLNTDTKELRQFLNENNFRGKGQVQFEQLLGLVTQQLQHEEYNAEILNKLYAVFYLLLPLNKPDLSFHELIETVSQLEPSTCLAQLRTVNCNIDLITMWFSRAEGDTVANTIDELKSINVNGMFYITVSSLVKISEDRILIKYQPQQNGSSSDVSGLPNSNEREISWNMTEIEDFVRRLGFSESGDENATMMRAFMELFEIVNKVQRLMESLHEMGHPDYSDTIFPYKVKCSDSTSKLKQLVMKTEKDEKEWSDKASSDRDNFKWLSFLSNGGVLELYKIICTADLSTRKIALKVFRQLRFLVSVHYSDDVMQHFEKSLLEPAEVPTEISEKLSKSIPVIKRIHKSPTEIVGSFLEKIFQLPKLQLSTPPRSSTFRSHAVLHQCHKFSPKELIVYLVSINEQTPKPYEILRCHSGTSESDVKLFFQRMEFFPRHYYFLEVNLLPTNLQESLLQQFMDVYERMLKSGSCSTVHFIETSSSLLYDAPYINITTLESYKDAENALTNDLFFVVELVYGLQGNGKTHYIKNKLGQSSVVLAINESFSVSRIVNNFNSLSDQFDCSIHFNFTLLPAGSNVADEERKQFTQLIDKIGWFMFDLFILGYVHDSHTGMSFTVPKGLNWKIYIEVPSVSNDPQINLSLFRDLIPTFCFIGTERHIDSSIPYVVDDDVQLVCKYLWALNEEKRRPGWGIDKLFYSDPVKFGDKGDIEHSECLRLLNEHMPDLMKEHKISQRLFIKYMKRRCQFLDNFPAYNYNQGRSPKGGKTKKLGSTLLNAMLKEVLQFCDPSTKEDWSIQAHQQLIYEQHSGGGSIDLITLYPNDIPPKEKESFQALGLEIPTMEKLYERSTLDEYLAKALSLPLSEVTEVVRVGIDNKGKPIEETHYKGLKIIDDNNYVLTLDYTLKMINIHERRECGMPVIIEGETGVGKTELLKMLSKLWNYSWEVQWSKQKEELQSLLVDIQKKRNIKPESSWQHQLTALEASINASVDDKDLVDGQCSDREVIMEALTKFKKMPIVSLLRPKHMRQDFWKFVDKPKLHEFESIFTFLKLLFAADVSTFHKLDVHSGLKPSDIISFFDEVNEQTERIKTFFCTSDCIPQVTVYLDEINTSSCMGLFKEIVIDRTIDGKPLPDNVFIIAACNPLRGDSTAVLHNMKNVWHKPSYYVRELHPTIDYLKWDYGALNDVQEYEYITAKMRILTKNVSSFKSEEITERLTHLVRQSQIKIREYAYHTLIKAAYSPQEAKKCARSCVSQRDMQRVFDFFKWLFNSYEQFQRFSTTKEQQVRALLVALGLVYYLRLGDEDRKSYSQFLNDECESLGNINFTTAFTEELDWYMDRVAIDLPPGIAKTTALKENVFANIVCCQTHTPLIIIGEPGTSKTLSFNIVANTFKGRASKHRDFKVIERFKGLQPFFYQCSQHTNSKEIENLFDKAIQGQKIYESSSVPTYCVVFMDEAGLPEERHESLKVLHYHLDKREVSFVAITNHALDAAKTNRAISLYRPETSTEDLEILASHLLHSTDPMTQDETKMVIANFCSAFSSIMKVSKFRDFYGQRDFLHFVSCLRRKRGSGFINEEKVLEALERNLNGHEDFVEVFNYFLKEMNTSYDDLSHKSVLKIVGDSLKDLPSSSSQTVETETRPDQFSYTEHGIRYKLIIDESEDDSAVRFLFACGALSKPKTRMFACSEFIEESHMHINTIAGIIHSVEQGHTILMFQTDEIHESFYELFNQRFRILDDSDKGLRLFTNISIGAHTKPCRVHPEFQCIVVVKKSELNKTPQPFLNRFEKFLFSYNTIYSSVFETNLPNMQVIIHIVVEKISSLINKLGGSRSFYGYIPLLQELAERESVDIASNLNEKNETLYSLILSLLPSLDHKYQTGCEIKEIIIDDDRCSTILATTLNSLRTKAGWNIPQMSDYELKVESSDIIFDMLLKDAGFFGAVEKPKFDFKGAVGEALDALHSSKGIVRIMDEDSCLIIAVIVQWLVRYVAKRLMHLLTPEALVVNAQHIPNVLMKSYFEFQEHFSLKILIMSYLKKLKRNQWQSKLCATKVLVYTRQSHLFGFLPSSYPSEGVKDDTLALLKSIVYDDLGVLKIYKITPDTLEKDIQRHVQAFVEKTDHAIFLIIANMQDVTLKMINHLRILVEQKENESLGDGKLFVFLLQFPQGQHLFTHCYPALFLNGWDHFYLDSLTTDVSVPGLPKPLQNVVDIRQCFHVALCIPNTNISVTLSLEPLLKEAIPVISPRVVVGLSDKAYNRPLSISKRQTRIKELLMKDVVKQDDLSLCSPVGKALCSLFTQYWDNVAVTKFLQDAAHFTFRHQSTLSITSYIQTKIKALFFEFIVYMLWKINEDCNLDCYYLNSSSTNSVENLFGDITGNLFFKAPSLYSLPRACRSLPPPENKGFEFPFFSIVYHYLEEMLDGCQEIVNKNTSSAVLNPHSSVSSKEIKLIEEKELFEVMKKKLQHIIDVTTAGKETIKDPMMLILLSVTKALNDNDLWQRYLRDFIKYKCVSDSQTTEDTYLSPVIDVYFDFNHNVKSKDPISLLAWVHVHSEVSKMDLIQTVNQIQRLELFLRDQPQDTFFETATSLLSPTKKNLGSFVIQRCFDSLDYIVSSWCDEKTEDVSQWYLAYRDIVQIASLFNSLHEEENNHLRLLFFKAHMMYILIISSDSLTPNSVKFAIHFYLRHIKMFDGGIETAASECILALKDQTAPFIYSVVDKILSFMFHTVNLPNDLPLCQWFFRAALPGCPNSVSLLEYISPAQYRYYLLHMLLAKDDQLATDQKDPNDALNLFQPLLRTIIGEMILTVDPLKCADVFIGNKPMSMNNEMCMLAKMYLRVAYDQICNVTTNKKLFTVVTKLETLFKKYMESCTDDPKKNLLILEKEAFMQRCLHLIASNLSQTIGSQEMILGRLPPRIDAVLQKEGLEDKRGLVLTMHLWKEVKSIEKLVRILTERPQDRITCLSIYSDQLRQCHDHQSVQFSFPLLLKEDGALRHLYEDICELMKKIHRKECEAIELKMVADTCKEEALEMDFSTDRVFQIQKINAVFMCIWLCTYYEYYQKNVKSESLVKAVNEQLEGYFPDQVIKLIICFLNKDLVQKQPELDTPSDLNAPMFKLSESLQVRPVQQRQGGRVDPIYKLFFPDYPDTHDRQICNALASVVAVTLACPDQATHLWYHIFSPDKLLRTYVTGFLLNSEIKEGRLYDCGVVLNEQGEYGRPEYLQRAEKGILNLHSLYLLLWCNFGAFCVSLLTQRGAIIKGTVISDYQAVRHYCKSQMNAMWLHMSTNLGLNDEQLSLLIVRSMQRMIQTCIEIPKSGLLNTSEQRDEYEKMWHQLVFVPSLDEVRTKFDQYSQILLSNQLLTELRLLKNVYPYCPTIQDFTHYVQEHCSSNVDRGSHELLVRFINRYPRLQAGGALLPSLIEFYQWIHTDLSYVITKKQANEMTVDDAVELAAGKYSKELEKHYTKLFEKITEGYNHYLETIGFSIGAGACANMRRENTAPRITKVTPLFRFLPGDTIEEKEEQRDFVFLVIEDIVNFHNHFLSEIKSLAQSYPAFQRYICDSILPSLHPAAINEYSCIVAEKSRPLLELIYMHQTEQGYDLDKIQEDIFVNYIAGKLKIADCRTKLQKTFHYKSESESKPTSMEHPTELMLTLYIVDDIDKDFKVPLSEEDDFLVLLKHELLSMDYEKIVEVAQGLKTITEHVKQRLDQDQLCKENIVNDTIREALPKLVYDQHETHHDNSMKIFDDLGMTRLQDSHRVRIGAIPMKNLFSTLELVVEWIKDGIYDFYTLPKAMKRPLRKHDKQMILGLQQTYNQTYPNDLLQKLKIIVEVLVDSQQHFVDNIDKIKEKNIFEYLRSDLDILGDEEDKILKCFPRQILLENYMELRICLRKLMNCLEEKKSQGEGEELKWFEYVKDLWSEEHLQRLRDVSAPQNFDEVYNPTTGLYGFQTLNDEEPPDDEDKTELVEEKPASSSFQIQHPPQDSNEDDLSEVASDLTSEDIADYLRFLKLDEYIKKFQEIDVDGITMLEIDNETLEKDLGVDTAKDRVKIKTKFKWWLRKRMAQKDK